MNNTRPKYDKLSELFKLTTTRSVKGAYESLNQRNICRLHQLCRKSGKHSELCLAIKEPTKNGISKVIIDTIGEKSILIGVEYEIDDGGDQQHGDLIIWDEEKEMLIALEIKRLRGGDWVEHHAAERLSQVINQAHRISSRLQSWLEHLVKYNNRISECQVFKKGSKNVVGAVLTEDGIKYV